MRNVIEKLSIYSQKFKRPEVAQFLYAFSISCGWYIEDGYRRIALLLALLLLWKSTSCNCYTFSDNVLFKVQKITLIALSVWFTFVPLFGGAAAINERISDMARPIEVIFYSIVGWRLAKEQSFIELFYRLSCISAVFLSVVVFFYRLHVSFSTLREHWFFDMRAEFAGIILLSLIPWLYCFIFEKGKIPIKKNILYYGVLLLAIISITVTYYRNVWVAWIVQFAVALILLPRVFHVRWRDSLNKAIIISIVCICMGGWAYDNNYEIRDNINSFIRFYKDADLDHFSSKRVEIWREAISLIRERPIVGYGWCDYNEFATIKKYNPHSSYLQAAFIGGIPGALLYCCVLILLWWQCILNIFYRQRNINISFAVVLMLTATIIAGMTESYIYVGREYLIPFWSIISVFVSSSSRDKMLKQISL